jgi:plasmid stabilization system protein ParE
MAYLVRITIRAQRDLSELYEQIDAERSTSEQKWYLALRRLILSLERYPNRCPVIHGQANLRHLLQGRKPYVYRVIYRVLERQKKVDILHIRHGARREPSASI